MLFLGNWQKNDNNDKAKQNNYKMITTKNSIPGRHQTQPPVDPQTQNPLYTAPVDPQTPNSLHLALGEREHKTQARVKSSVS